MSRSKDTDLDKAVYGETMLSTKITYTSTKEKSANNGQDINDIHSLCNRGKASAYPPTPV